MKKGFTLVELLAVIVILAVIALITIPLIGNIIEDSKKKALEQSVYGIVEAANYFALENKGEHHFIFDENNEIQSTTGKFLSYKGQIGAEGDLYIDSEGNISLCLKNENYYVYKNYNSGIYIGNIKDDTCISGYDALTNKYIAMLDDGTGEVSNVYSKEQVDSLVTNLQSQIYSNDTDIEGLNSNVNSLTSMVNNNSENITNLQNDLVVLTDNVNYEYSESGLWRVWKYDNGYALQIYRTTISSDIICNLSDGIANVNYNTALSNMVYPIAYNEIPLVEATLTRYTVQNPWTILEVDGNTTTGFSRVLAYWAASFAEDYDYSCLAEGDVINVVTYGKYK